MSNPELIYYLSSESQNHSRDHGVRQSHTMQLPGSWSWPGHHFSRWKTEQKSISPKRGAQILLLMCPRCEMSFIKHGNGEIFGMIPSFPIKFLCCCCLKVSHYRNFTKCIDFPSTWFSLVNTLSQEQLIPMWQHIIKTQWWQWIINHTCKVT